jgi:BirA family biotin operon repressor/biotin-[acetyl-CoA-carboxylase] ligase
MSKESVTIDESKIAKFIKDLGTKGAKNIDVSQIKDNLNTEYIGNKIYGFQEIESTNTIAKFLAGTGVEEGTVVMARTQTGGRGRSGKKWESPVGGIWLSIILRPDISPTKASLITLATGIAVANAIRNLGIDARIKWPNDILINNKKISGILTEANTKFSVVDYVVVGIGIDSNLDIDTLPENLQTKITSLKNELDKNIDENEVIKSLLEEFEKIYNVFIKEDFDEIIYQWRNLAQTIGNDIEIRQRGGKIFKGYAVGINKKGALIMELDNGELKKIISGECRPRKRKK